MPTSLVAAAEQIKSRRVAPVDLLRACMERIGRYEAQVRAWVVVDEAGALRQAERLSAELDRGEYRGPLHGIPLAIKDIVDVAGFPTLAGSAIRAGHVAERDATIVERLRDAGAIILGKTVTTEFASFDPPPTRNPWNLERTPGGSSSGSAAAVACGMCLGAIGSQTGGSITRPAAFCGVVGIKPTFGAVSTSGVLPLAPHMDHPGPLARTVADAAAILDAIGGHDPADPWSDDRPWRGGLFPVERTDPPRIGVLGGMFRDLADAEVRSVFDLAVTRLAADGAQLSEHALPEAFDDVLVMHRRIMAVESAAVHREPFAIHRDRYGRHIRALIEEGLAVPALDYADALARRRWLCAELLAGWGPVDAWLTPATTSTAPSIETTGDPRLNSPWSYVGYPTVTLPAGLAADGMPVGLQLIGRPRTEPRLASIAAWCEERLGFDARPPLDLSYRSSATISP